MWGGGLYLAVTGAVALSVLLPLLLFCLVAVFGVVPGVAPSSLWFFGAVFVFGGVVPAVAAHSYRSLSPVECKRHAKVRRRDVVSVCVVVVGGGEGREAGCECFFLFFLSHYEKVFFSPSPPSKKKQ